MYRSSAPLSPRRQRCEGDGGVCSHHQMDESAALGEGVVGQYRVSIIGNAGKCIERKNETIRCEALCVRHYV